LDAILGGAQDGVAIEWFQQAADDAAPQAVGRGNIRVSRGQDSGGCRELLLDLVG
jgi:hypothetical protein